MANEGLVTSGALLLVVGVVLSFLSFLCLVGIPMAVVGFILLIVGVAMEEPQPQVLPYPYPSAPYPWPRSPIPFPHCPRCGQLLRFVTEYQRWYCAAENVYPWG